MIDKELKLEEIEASNTVARWSRALEASEMPEKLR
jgi:hypothetical protein